MSEPTARARGSFVSLERAIREADRVRAQDMAESPVRDRDPLNGLEKLVVDAFERVTQVLEVRLRWKPPVNGSLNPLAHFHVVMLIVSPVTEELIDKIEAELRVRVQHEPSDLCIDYVTPLEAKRLASDSTRILRRPLQWFYDKGYEVPR